MINKIFLFSILILILLFLSMIVYAKAYNNDLKNKDIQAFTKLSNQYTLSFGHNYMNDRFSIVNTSQNSVYPFIKDTNYMEFIYDK